MLTADRTVHTTCPYCGVGCQIDLLTKDDVIFRVNGRFDNNVNQGNLCVKGRFGYDFVYAPDRLTQPLVRQADQTDGRQNGAMRRSAWDEALNQVAAHFRRIRDEHGPDAIAILTSAKCTNEENYLLQKFARAVIGTNNVDHCARL